jgi:preprotein translocase subunit SecA
MGQKDPLAEWQREGFDMFEAMMGQIQDNFVAYVSHLQVAKVEDAPRAPSGNRMRYSSSDDAEQGAAAMRAAAAGIPAEDRAGDFAPGPEGAAPVVANEADHIQQPVRVEKTPGRNEPCFCGSGKKYKLCHGR